MDVLLLILFLVTGIDAPSTEGASSSTSATTSTSTTTTETTLDEGGDTVRKQPVG